MRSLLDALADVVEEHDGSLQVTRNGLLMVVRPPKHKDVATVEDLLDIRRFLEKSGETASPQPVPPGAQTT